MADDSEMSLAILPTTTTRPTLCPPTATESSPLTPFSAVAPPPFLAVSRLHIHITLETIHEEENEGEINELLPQNSSLTSTPFSSTCFLEVQKAPLSSYNQITSS
ncbi:hypothetical protein SLEP1_g6331 [Rubroshorea leprosula]|uniref:Uncharacterized protein n=1 Tax=Rubroshorea leprosula TaxID=152421 RepID=A0AAV5I4N6_9ROSI|nr:hypothetical protein SLEP1_g6331 [Rubroshorea leprosula]